MGVSGPIARQAKPAGWKAVSVADASRGVNSQSGSALLWGGGVMCCAVLSGL